MILVEAHVRLCGVLVCCMSRGWCCASAIWEGSREKADRAFVCVGDGMRWGCWNGGARKCSDSVELMLRHVSCSQYLSLWNEQGVSAN